MLRAIALALRVLMLRAIALALRVLMLRAIALALRARPGLSQIEIDDARAKLSAINSVKRGFHPDGRR